MMPKRMGSKLARSETVTIRLDPRLKYLAEISGRLHRRSLSSYIEWAVQQAVARETVNPYGTPNGFDETIGSQSEYLWHFDEQERFRRLAEKFPHLLTYDEQVAFETGRSVEQFKVPAARFEEQRTPSPMIRRAKS